LGICASSAFLVGVAPIYSQVTLTEINPDQSTLDVSNPNGATGGRVNGLARATDATWYAASEWGGIYKSVDAGRHWQRLNGHLPTVTWDVEVSPAALNRVFASSFYDGRVNSLAGINVSTDGGLTWVHPATAVPPAGFCRVAARRDEPSAFGISIDPDNPQNVYIGTNCGLAISNDGGTTWRFVDPTPANGANDVWDVTAHDGGIIDVCGDDGHRRSVDGGNTWTTASSTGTPLPSGRCSIAVSPDESYVLVAVVGTSIFESDDAGGTWNSTFTNPAPQGRIPFVATNKRGGNNFDLWFGDVSLFRATCTTPQPPASGGTRRCPANVWAGGFTRSRGAHDDTGDILFTNPPRINVPQCLADCTAESTSCRAECRSDRDACMAAVGGPGGTTAAQCVQIFARCNSACARQLTNCRAVCQRVVEGCPMAMSSDGGVYFNTLIQTPGCQTPLWEQPTVTPHGLWLFGMGGADTANNVLQENLYFGNQDNGTFATANAGAAVPTWSNRDCCDGFDAVGGPDQVVYTVCCFSPPPGNRVFLRKAGMTGGGEIPNYPPGAVPGFAFADVIDRFGPNRYVLITTSGVFATTDITATPTITWTQLGATTSPLGACSVIATGTAASPTFYVQAGSCSSSGADRVFRYQGAGAGGTWQQVNPPGGAGAGFGIFAADRANPNRLFASQIASAGPQMIRSTNGGQNWTNDAALDTLMTGGGTFRFRTTRGPANFTSFAGYSQPTLVALDPQDPNLLVAGGADSGVFVSRNGGTNWTTVTNNSGNPANPHVPRPRFAYFDRECGSIHAYLGTQGRGVWRLTLENASEAPCLTNCTNVSTECRSECQSDRDSCMAEVGQPGGPLAKQCVQQFVACNSSCSSTLVQCRERCHRCPSP
jgi:photosystem II stability/assembly factor-like uncharacterized protein